MTCTKTNYTKMTCRDCGTRLEPYVISYPGHDANLIERDFELLVCRDCGSVQVVEMNKDEKEEEKN